MKKSKIHEKNPSTAFGGSTSSRVLQLNEFENANTPIVDKMTE